MNKLAIDTSTDVLGVAIMQDEKVTVDYMTHVKKDHSTRLMPAIHHVMDEVTLQPEQLDAIIVSNGPGSYTGTRIGVTAAKTLAWSLQIPIYTESTLRNLAKNARYYNTYICPFIDARRKNVFTGLYQTENARFTTVIEDQHIAMDQWLSELSKLNGSIVFVSPHMDTFQSLIVEQLAEKAIFLDAFHQYPKASSLLEVPEEKEPTPVHTVTPNYLRITEAEANLIKHKKEES